MILDENMEMTGKLTIELNGEVVQEIPNLVTTAGKGYVASRMKDASATAMSHMAIGTNNTAAAAGNTALGAESARQALTTTTSQALTLYTLQRLLQEPALLHLQKREYLTLLLAEQCYVEPFSQP